MSAVDKRDENKLVRILLRELGYDGIRVGHSGHGWLDISVTIDKSFNCTCTDTPRNVGLCKTCSDVWHEAYVQITTRAKERTGRTGKYDGHIQVQIDLL
jgi:hypothetical protein